jgi:septum formation protein
MVHNILKGKTVILASASPRRKQIFELLGITALCLPADIDEPITDEKPYVQAKNNALNKARATSVKVESSALIVASDTVVYVDGRILGKPENEFQARDYLRILSGNTHYVYSSICLSTKNRYLCDYERSKVRFGTLSESEIDDYLKTREPMDKAGAYGIQGYGSQFIENISGCYFNIMGLPIRLFYKLLREMYETE